jgi:hypothetical protein
MASNNPVANLASMSMRQLRELARTLGISRYSAQNREGLAGAIADKAGLAPEEAQAALSVSAPFAVGASADLTGPEADLQELESDMAPAPRPDSETRVVFLPRDPQWAYAFWEIAEGDREAALAAGASQLCLRVADVTGLPGGSSHPHTLQEVVVDSKATEWYLPVPLSDRDYRVELGFRSPDGWISLAFSSVARVPAVHPSEQILDQFVPFSLESLPEVSTDTAPPTSEESGLHERLYQTATARWRRLGRGSEAFHEFGDSEAAAAAAGLHHSGVGQWASGRSESGAGGVPTRQRAFWLVADAELIVYGATDPSARLTIGGEEVPLSAEGTFRIQVPFRDGQQLYPIEAVAADGEQRRNITLEFRRTTPAAQVNTLEEAVPEWF